jgi:hypothetical protein
MGGGVVVECHVRSKRILQKQTRDESNLFAKGLIIPELLSIANNLYIYELECCYT